LLERDTFDLFLPEFDKPWVIHLRKTSCCFINLYTWRPNTVYKNRSVRRHHPAAPKNEDRDSGGALDLVKFCPPGNRGFFPIYRGVRRRRVETDHPGPNEPRRRSLF
jgi:hypothetical protein